MVRFVRNEMLAECLGEEMASWCDIRNLRKGKVKVRGDDSVDERFGS